MIPQTSIHQRDICIYIIESLDLLLLYKNNTIMTPQTSINERDICVYIIEPLDLLLMKKNQ